MKEFDEMKKAVSEILAELTEEFDVGSVVYADGIKYAVTYIDGEVAITADDYVLYDYAPAGAVIEAEDGQEIQNAPAYIWETAYNLLRRIKNSIKL